MLVQPHHRKGSVGGSHVEYRSPLLNRTLQRMAYAPIAKRPAKPKVERRPPRHGDDLVLTILRRHRAGEPIPRLAAIFGISEWSIGNWARGQNRGHLLAQIEREESIRKAAA